MVTGDIFGFKLLLLPQLGAGDLSVSFILSALWNFHVVEDYLQLNGDHGKLIQAVHAVSWLDVCNSREWDRECLQLPNQRFCLISVKKDAIYFSRSSAPVLKICMYIHNGRLSPVSEIHLSWWSNESSNPLVCLGFFILSLKVHFCIFLKSNVGLIGCHVGKCP